MILRYVLVTTASLRFLLLVEVPFKQPDQQLVRVLAALLCGILRDFCSGRYKWISSII